jgi:hypothetical protein
LFYDGKCAGERAIDTGEMVEWRKELKAWRQIPQVHKALDERDARAQDCSVHYKLLSRPAGTARGWLFEEVATYTFWLLFY